jgi:hypothetical protein
MTSGSSILALATIGTSLLACSSGESVLRATVDDGDALTDDMSVSLDAAIADDAADATTTAPEAAASSDAPVSNAGDADDAGATMGSLPAVPTLALLRFANWSPDAPAADLCIAPHGTLAFQGPLVAALATASESDAGVSGIAFPLVSAYSLVPPGRYDVRIVVAGTESCAVGIGQDATALPVVSAGGAETVALVGEVAPGGADYKLHVLGFLDDVSATSSAAIRVINAAPALPLVDVGTGTLASSSFLAIFRGVSIGQASAPIEGWVPLLVDPNGYDTNKPISGAKLSAHGSGTTVDAVVAAAFSAPSDAVMTIVVAGGTSGTSPALVACTDNAGISGVLSDCTVLTPAGM